MNFPPRITAKKLTLTSGSSQLYHTQHNDSAPPGARLRWFLAVCGSPGAGGAQATSATAQNSSLLHWTCDPKERPSAQIPLFTARSAPTHQAMALSLALC